VQESSPLLYQICLLNPFTYAVELVRFAFYGRIEWLSLLVVAVFTLVFLGGAILAYDPTRGLTTRKQETGGNN
ncbi:MAG: ABC transporter permease, partial [Allorhizobium sp.]